LLPHSTYFIRQFLVFVLFVGYCFGKIMCVRDSYVYQIGGLCFLFVEVMSGRLAVIFIRNYVAIPVQVDVVALQYISWCVPVFFNQISCFCQFLVDYFCYSIMSF